ncbi:MAG TPA: M23 family metallopeptidase [Rhizomicrobium sp.]|nr:M23 family metallopeptidase [Rhizomicrobium sp.]
MKRSSQPTLSTAASDWRRSARAAAAALSTTDGRWALLSTSLTAMIAGTVAWLAVGTMPPLKPHGFHATRTTTFLPYQLFLKLTQGSGDTKYAAIAPFGGAGANRVPDEIAKQPPLDDENKTPGIETRTLTLEHGDTFAGALQDAGISGEDAGSAVAALAKVYDPRDLRAGQSFEITYSTQPQTQSDASDGNAADGDEDDADASGPMGPATTTPVGHLVSVSFSPSVEHDIAIARDETGAFVANDTVKELSAHVHRAGATIEGSLYLSAMRAGIPADVVVEMIHMFSYEVDFQRDIRPGNSFEVFYSYYYTPEGQPARNGNISYATMHLGSRTIALYRYQPDANEPADYFDAKGQSAKSMLMKTPVDGARISSGFGMRFHPVLGYSRMHKGIDFAVPVGTPVMAAGSGVVQLAGHLGGYGNYLRINHQNGYGTAYGHLSRLAPGIHAGSHVHQGQIVAYSGNTGMSTGPHLHYEILVGGSQVNPLKVKVATGRRLMGRELHNYLLARMHTDAQLASMKLETRVADISADLRQAKAK